MIGFEENKDKELDKLLSYIDGTMEAGLGIGIPKVDEYMSFKRNSFMVSLARAKTGKTLFKLWYYVVLAKKHGLRFRIAAFENDIWTLKMYINQFLEGNFIKNLRNEVIKNNKWIDYHFEFLPSKNMSFQEIMDLSAKEIKDCTWIDPFNGMETKDHGHNAEYDIVRSCNRFKSEIGSIDMSIHPVTELNRMTHKETNHPYNGYPVPARSFYAEGGGKWQNAVDMFYSYHRYKSHPIDYRQTMVFVEEVRVSETGGKVTPEGAALIFDLDPKTYRFLYQGIDILEEDSFFDNAEEWF